MTVTGTVRWKVISVTLSNAWKDLKLQTDRVLNCLSLTYMYANDEIMVLYYSSVLYCTSIGDTRSQIM